MTEFTNSSIERLCARCGFVVSALNLVCSNCGDFLQGSLSGDEDNTGEPSTDYQMCAFTILEQSGCAETDQAKTMFAGPIKLSQLELIPEWKLARCDPQPLLICAKFAAGAGNVPLSQRFCLAAMNNTHPNRDRQFMSDLGDFIKEVFEAPEAKRYLRVLSTRPGWLTAVFLALAFAPAFLVSLNPDTIGHGTLAAGFAWFTVWYGLALHD
jgi:hypothetical protein